MRSRGVAIVLLVVGALLFVACSGGWRDVYISEYVGTPESTEIQLTVGACVTDLSFEVDERADEVEVSVVARGEEMGDCQSGVTIELSSPLGDRVILDAFDGMPVEPRSAMMP